MPSQIVGIGWAIVTVTIFAVGVYYSAEGFAALDKSLAVALISGAALIGAAWISRIFEKRKETEAHFRQKKYEQYSEFLGILYGYLSQSQIGSEEVKPEKATEVVKQINAWQWRLILFASPTTIRSYVTWMDDLKKGVPRVRTILLMESFFRSLRADLGISNLGLDRGDFGHLVLQQGALFAEMAVKDPNMTLQDLSIMEKKLRVPTALPVLPLPASTEVK